MFRFISGKAAQALVVLLVAYTVTFVLLYVLPQDVVDLMFDVDQTTTESAAERDKLRAYYGLDSPIAIQFFIQLFRILTGDFGVSVATGRPVLEGIGEVLAPTLVLAASALALALIVAFAVAIVATITRWEWLSGFLRALPSAAVSLPVFLVGLVLLQVFSYQLRWFPSIGDQGLLTLVLPAIALAIPVSAPIAQLLTTNLEAELARPYATTAAAKGLRRGAVVSREVFRNACLPALTIAGITFGNLLSGAIIIETIFARPGIGRLTETAVRTQDVAVVQGVVLLAAFAFVTINFVVDTTYPFLDPRLRGELLGRGRRVA